MLLAVATARPFALFEAYNICGPGGWEGDLMVVRALLEGNALSRHSGAMRSIKPGIHFRASDAARWIPGSRYARPGMTTFRAAAI
jgi:hypothetical protein